MSLARTEPFQSPCTLFTRGGYFSVTTRTKGGSIHRFLGIAVLGSTIALAFAGAAAAATPSAITGPVTSVGPTTATATGTVNPNGQATTWYVEYGTSTSYGTKTANVSAGSGTANTAVSASLTGLTAGTTYHYRVVATNGAGTDRGADGIFTTSAGPVAVTGSATSVTTTTATLNGTVDPNGRATTWYFEYGTSTGYGSKTAEKSAGSGTSTTSVAAPVSGLTRGRLYHYRLVATSDAGTSRGADQTFSTVTSPTAVTGAASSIAPTSAKLNGTVTPNGQATTWYFEYGTSTSYGSKTAAKSAGSGTGSVKVAASVTRPAKDDDLPLPPRRDERLRDDRRRRPELQHVACALRPHGRRPERRRDDRDADGRRRPKRPGDELVLRVRDDHGLRIADADPQRALGRRRANRDRAAHKAHAGDDLPLPARRDERRRDGSRSRRDVHDGRRHARRRPRSGSSTDAASRCRDPSRSSGRERP